MKTYNVLWYGRFRAALAISSPVFERLGPSSANRGRSWPGDLETPWGSLRYLEPSWTVLGLLLGRLERVLLWASSVLARLGPSRSKNVDFPLVFKAKIRKTLKKRYVLKASNGKTPARIKKISEKKKRTTTGRFWVSSFFGCRKQNYVKLCTPLEGEPRELGEGFQQ